MSLGKTQTNLRLNNEPQEGRETTFQNPSPTQVRFWPRLLMVQHSKVSKAIASDPPPHPKHGCARRRRLLGTSAAVRVIQRQGQDGRRRGGGGRGEDVRHLLRRRPAGHPRRARLLRPLLLLRLHHGLGPRRVPLPLLQGPLPHHPPPARRRPVPRRANRLRPRA